MSSFTIEIAEHKTPPPLIQIDLNMFQKPPLQWWSVHISDIFAWQVHRLAFPPWWITSQFIFIVRIYCCIQVELKTVFTTRTHLWFKIKYNSGQHHHRGHRIASSSSVHMNKANPVGRIKVFIFEQKLPTRMHNQHVNSFIHQKFPEAEREVDTLQLSDNTAWYSLEIWKFSSKLTTDKIHMNICDCDYCDEYYIWFGITITEKHSFHRV